MTKKSAYPRICHNHPDVVTNLYYVYHGGRVGKLLCEDCQEDDRKNYASQRKVSDLWTNEPQ